ncbi:hypothetical protein PTE30175_05563 [Pandoraea terrae]|uniref:Uncharacterized protein n=1 Tax=Pandoraea terrae TaxID=1537710 RepID=A0A5E4ZEY6_9BURK|nr:hypothetical protein [Pandoraea terrae]VVE59644.1 hypothetical protein PTE30175_05563 [Pandoraea terrae]
MMIAIVICKCWLIMAMTSAPPPVVQFDSADGGWSAVLMAGAVR